MNKIDDIKSISDCSFSQLISYAPIRIPKIQRDYAQGRQNDSVNDIRNKFVDSLINAIRTGTAMEMDFIYGSSSKDAFEPLDGQQRLTTMFLLHWMLGVSLFDKMNEESFLTYETRNTSKEFTIELVHHNVSQYIEERKSKAALKAQRIKECQEAIDGIEERYEEKTSKEYYYNIKAASDKLSEAKEMIIPSVSDLIQSKDWFDYLWRYDPTIQSMLVMIDTIYEKMDWSMNLDDARANLDKITFSYLDLGYFGLSDELFIKMNARGKQLSSFDIMKSTLEEEIQVQIKENHCTSELEAKWRSMVDGEWIDWFWNMYAAQSINEITESEEEYHKRLTVAKDCEEKLKRMILRTIALELQTRESLNEELDLASYRDDAYSLDRLMTIYQNSLRDSRKDGGIPDTNAEIDFDLIIRNIKCLYYKEGGVYKSIFDLIPRNYRINENYRDASSLDIFLAEKNPNDARIIFYALQCYLKEYPVVLEDEMGNSTDEGSPENQWLTDFVDWAHCCRNIFINDNNNVRIDRQMLFKNAISGVNKMITLLKEFKADSEIIDRRIVSFFASLSKIENVNIPGVDKQSLVEEIEKAKLRVNDPDWTISLSSAEENSYVWGQVRALIEWSGKDRNRFEEYSRRLTDLLSYSYINSDLIHACMVSLTPDHGFKTSKLFVLYNKDRDYSMKRYLRDETFHSEYGCYAPAMKALIDKWIYDYPSLKIEDFLYKVVEECNSEVNSYRRCIVCRHDILSAAYFKMIYQNNGHYILAQKKTSNSHCFDIALLYLTKQLCDKTDIFKDGDIKHYSSADIEHQYALTYKVGESIFIVQQLGEGAYELRCGEMVEQEFANEKELLDYFDERFSLRQKAAVEQGG